jgi:hypothetical protein
LQQKESDVILEETMAQTSELQKKLPKPRELSHDGRQAATGEAHAS